MPFLVEEKRSWGHIHAHQDTSALLVTQAYGCSTHEILGSVAAPLVREHNTTIKSGRATQMARGRRQKQSRVRKHAQLVTQTIAMVQLTMLMENGTPMHMNEMHECYTASILHVIAA